MASLRYLADMNLSPQTVRILADAGYDIIRVSDVMPVSARDKEILEYARQREMVVVSQDLDFSALVAVSGATEPSLVNVRMSTGDPVHIGRRLRDVLPRLRDAIEKGACVTVDDSAARVRDLPIDV